MVLVVLGVLGRWRGEISPFGQIGPKVRHGGNNEVLMTTLLPRCWESKTWKPYNTSLKKSLQTARSIMKSLIPHYYLHDWLLARFARNGKFPSLPLPPSPEPEKFGRNRKKCAKPPKPQLKQQSLKKSCKIIVEVKNFQAIQRFRSKICFKDFFQRFC